MPGKSKQKTPLKRKTPDTPVKTVSPKKKYKPSEESARGPRVKNWCFTDFEELDYQRIFNQGSIRYLVVGKRVCSNGSTFNQGYIQFYTYKRLVAVQAALTTKKAHIEACRGSPQQNYNYVLKSKVFDEWGKMLRSNSGRKPIKEETALGVLNKDINKDTEARSLSDIDEAITEETAKIINKEKTLTSSTKTGLTRNDCIAVALSISE